MDQKINVRNEPERKTKMRVIQLGPYPPPHGGVQYNLMAIRNYLADRKIPSRVINIIRSPKTDAEGVYYPRNWLQLLWLLIRLRCDILHLHIGGSVTFRLLGLSLVCCSLPGTKAILTFHSGGYPQSSEGITAGPRTLRGFVFRRFDGIITVNQELVELFHRFGVNPDRIRLILPYSLPDLQQDMPIPEPMEAFLRRSDPALITVGQLEPEYNLHLQIDALESLSDKHPNIGLIIIGSGGLGEDLKNRIESGPCAGNIMLCGDLPNHLTLQLMARSNLFLRTTSYDGDAISIREALHLGIPVIATDTGMRPAGVSLIPSPDREILIRTVEEHLERSVGRLPLSEAGEDNISAVFEFYKELLE